MTGKLFVITSQIDAVSGTEACCDRVKADEEAQSQCRKYVPAHGSENFKSG